MRKFFNFIKTIMMSYILAILDINNFTRLQEDGHVWGWKRFRTTKGNVLGRRGVKIDNYEDGNVWEWKRRSMETFGDRNTWWRKRFMMEKFVRLKTFDDDNMNTLLKMETFEERNVWRRKLLKMEPFVLEAYQRVLT